MVQLPTEGFVRLKDILGNPKANPPILGIIPISKTSWFEGVRAGKFPKPCKFGVKTSLYRVEDIRNLISEIAQ